jgi:hypothetical protein
LISNLAPASQRQGSSLKEDIRELYSNNEEARAAATNRLFQAGPAAIPLLVGVVCDGSKPNFDMAWPSAAKILGHFRAESAVGCLTEMLGSDPTLEMTAPRELLVQRDPAYATLVEIGEPAVPAIGRRLTHIGFEQAYLALRILREINSPPAKKAAELYLSNLENQIRISKQLVEGFR